MRPWWVLAVIVLPVAAATSSFQADMEVRGAALFQGDGALGLTLEGAMLDARDQPTAQGSLHVLGPFHYAYYEVNERYLEGDDGSPLGQRRIVLDEETRLLDSGTVHAAWSGAALRDEFSLRIVAEEGVVVPWNGSFMLGPAVVPAEDYDGRSTAEPGLDGARLYPGTGSPWSPGSPVSYAGSQSIQVYGATIHREDGASFFTGVHDTDTTVAPDGRTRLVDATHRILVLEGSGQSTLEGAWLHYVSRLDGFLRGDLELVDAKGTGSINATNVRDPHLLAVKGEFDVLADYSRSPAQWEVAGEATFVALDAVTFYGSRDAHLLASAVAGGISLALLWAVLSKTGKELLAFVGLRTLADPLGNENRLDILRMITNNPGITVSMLCQEAGLSRSAVQHHIGILARADLVSRHQPGKIAHWTLNSGSLDVPAPDAGPGSIGPATLREAYAASGHPKRQLILETLAELGECHYGDLEQHWTTHRVTPLRQDEVSYHGKKLVEAGLATRARRQGRTIWTLSVASDETIALQLANFLRGQPAAEELLRLARAADPQNRTVPKHHVPTSRHARRQIRLLEGVGLLQPAPSGQGFVLASHAESVANRL